MEDCIFCSIVEDQVPAKKVYEDDLVLAFHDVAPQAPVHILVVPKVHVTGMNQADALPDETLARVLRVAAKLAGEMGLRERGYRIVSNCGVDACQSVQHLHVHLLGGRAMGAELA
jgi:histidine triad (HIT) family protein